jgi:transcriptional regulator with XRE-family HTH domain
VDAGDEARTIGRRVRQIRKARRKSLTVLAGLSGMSIATLSRIENGLVHWTVTQKLWPWLLRWRFHHQS